MGRLWIAVGVKDEELLQSLFHGTSLDYRIDKTVLQKELGTLETFGQFLTDGLLDYAGAGKSDQGVRLCKDYVAEHGEAGRYTARRRVGQD